MRNKKLFLYAFYLLFSIALPAAARATELSDVVTGLKALPLLINKINDDTVIMAIVYDPANEASRSDAEGIKKAVDNGITVPGVHKLSAILVGVNSLGKLSSARIAFLTPGLAEHYDDISTATSAASILTFSTDINCVKAAKCIIGVETKPSVTIYFSKPAADDAKIEFSQAFSMLVKQP